MKLKQGQIWHKEDKYFRIVKWARLQIDYQEMSTLQSKEGARHVVTKKVFCRLIKGATLIDPSCAVVSPGSGDSPRKRGPQEK